MTPRLLALVKWIGGADDKKYTSGVPVEWIKGFDYDDFRSSNFDSTLSYVIEWHEGKEPRAGWPVFDGYVIEVSSRISLLENKLEALDGLMSPTKILTSQHRQTGTELSSFNEGKFDESSKTENKISHKNIQSTENAQKNSTACDIQNTRSLEVINKKAAKRNKKKDDDEILRQLSKTPKIPVMCDPDIPGCSKMVAKKLKPANDLITDDDSSPAEVEQSSGDEKSINTEMSGVARFNRKKYKARLNKITTEGRFHQQTTKEISIARGDHGNTLLAIQKELKLLRKKSFKHTDTSDSSEDEMKPIGRTGSEIFITGSQWSVANRARSYTAMGISLLMSLFPMKTLLKSNLRGGCSKINKQDGGKNYNALNPKILEALYYTIRKKWKTTFTDAGLGNAINNKLTRLRSAKKKIITVQADQEEPESESHDGMEKDAADKSDEDI